MSYDVVTIGSATLDYFADTDSELIRIDTRQHHEALIAFPIGSKVLVRDLKIMTGGGGTNTAVNFSRLGLHTAYLGKVGADESGQSIIDSLKAEGVDFIGARAGISGLSYIVDSLQSDRTIFSYKGCNNHLQYSEVQPFDAQWIYMSSMLGQSLETMRQIASNFTAKLVFNPSNYQAEQGYRALREIIDTLEVLIVNKEEACLLLGMNRNESKSISSLLRRMLAWPPKLFVITDGENGAYVCDREVIYHGLPLPDLKIVETTGAGDAFAAGFTAGLIHGLPVIDALKLGMTQSESVLGYKGAKENLLTLDAAKKQMLCNRLIDQNRI